MIFNINGIQLNKNNYGEIESLYLTQKRIHKIYLNNLESLQDIFYKLKKADVFYDDFNINISDNLGFGYQGKDICVVHRYKNGSHKSQYIVDVFGKDNKVDKVLKDFKVFNVTLMAEKL